MEKLTTLKEVNEPGEISQISDRLSSLRHSKHDDDEDNRTKYVFWQILHPTTNTTTKLSEAKFEKRYKHK